MPKRLTSSRFATLLMLVAVVLFLGCPKSESPSTSEGPATGEGEATAEGEKNAEKPIVEPPIENAPTGEQPSVTPSPEEIPAAKEPEKQPAKPVELEELKPPAVEQPAGGDQTVKPLNAEKVTLLVQLPDSDDTPDGMCLMPNGNIALSVPNVNSYLATADHTQVHPPKLMQITPDNKLEPLMDFPLSPKTGKGFPFGICVGPNGDLYVADLQWFADPDNPDHNSRVLRIPMKDGKPDGEPVVLIEGMVVANAVICHGGYLYVSDTVMIPGSEPLVSGVFRVKLDEEGTKLTQPIEDDPHLVATIQSYNPDVGFGADGLTFDSKGNLYIGNFADGTLHKVEFDADGKVTSNKIFAKSPKMRSCDGIFCDLKTDKIYVADSLANAIQVVSPDGTVETLVQDVESNGANGRLDQPCEVVIRGNQLIFSNFDMPVAGGVNTKFETPNTISVIDLPE